MLHRHSTAILVLLHALLAASAAQAAPTLVFSHAGCADPATAGPDPSLENWTLGELVAPGAVAAACGDAGTDAWEVSDPDATLAGPRYAQDASAVAGAADGWTLRARARVRDLGDAVDGSSALEVSIGGLRFRLLLGSDAVGNTHVRRESDAVEVIAQAPAFEQTGYHLYELSFDPASGQADLFVDGLLVAPGWSGAATLDTRVLFGADDVAGIGAARYSDLAFLTGVQECRNGADDDGDGRIDLVVGDADPGCSSPSDPSEKSVLRACDNGADDDGDGAMDLADPDCTSPVTGRSERPGFAFVTSGEAEWAAAAGGETLAFDTTAANVGLATQLGAPPAAGAFLCGHPSTPVPSCRLDYSALDTQLCRDVSLRSLEAGGGITYDDSAERNDFSAWQEALSIGDINDHQNDDFELSFGAGDAVYAFGFHFVDNQRETYESLTVYGPGDEVLGILPGNAAPLSDGNRSAFVGIVSPLPITRVVFDESPDPDDLAIRDFRFGDPDPDADGLGDCAEAGLGTNPVLADTDADGLADGDELAIHGTDPLDADSDDDSLADGAEVDTHGSDPLDADSDDDGLGDGDEVATHATDPADSDSDDDGLSDGAEVATHATDPLDPDSDDDGIPDGPELDQGTSPLDADSDDDALGDGAELLLGSNPTVADSDADGLADGAEVNVHGSSPTLADTDSDGLGDGAEVNTHGTNPASADSDGDGLSDGAEVNVHGTNPNVADGDADGLSDGAEIGAGTDPANPDSDGDGLADGAEVGTHGTDPLAADSDSDGLSDGAEVMAHGTDPLDADSDGDLFPDGDEIAAGTDPNDPSSFPVPKVPAMGTLGRLLAAGLVLLAGLRFGRRGPTAAS